MFNVIYNNLYMQSHKDAYGIRNKPFPSFDELAIIIRKD